MKKIQFALIGLGGMGSRWASVIAEHSSLAVIDPSREGTPIFNDILKDKYINAVLIATRHGDLHRMTREALKAGKHVLCEKPGALKARDIAENMEIARANDLTYMVGYNHRFHDGFIKARQLWEQGKIGDIVFIRARYGFGGRKDYDKEWRLNKKMGGSGELVDQGVHMIDLVLSFIGAPDETKGFTSGNFWGKDNEDIGEDNAFVLLAGVDNELASIHVSLTQWKRMHNFEIYGTKGYLSIEGLGRRYGGDSKGHEQLIFCERRADFGEDIKEQVIKCNSVADDSLKLMLKEFLSAIKEKRNPVPSGLDAYNTLRVVEEVYKQNKS